MSLLEVNWSPTARQLRQFGFLCLALLPALGWWFAGLNWTVIGTLAGIGAALAAVGVAKPMALKPVFVGLTLAALPIGFVVSQLTLLALYFGVLTPIGLVFRLMGRDALERKFQPGADTYWQPKRRPAGVRSYYRQS